MGKYDWLGWAIGGAIAGATMVYVATRPKITRLEARIAELEAQNIDLNQKVRTLKGHNESLKGYIREANRRITTLEGEVSHLTEHYDWIITELQYVESQVKDENARQLVRELIERARRRKAERVLTS